MISYHVKCVRILKYSRYLNKLFLSSVHAIHCRQGENLFSCQKTIFRDWWNIRLLTTLVGVVIKMRIIIRKVRGVFSWWLRLKLWSKAIPSSDTMQPKSWKWTQLLTRPTWLSWPYISTNQRIYMTYLTYFWCCDISQYLIYFQVGFQEFFKTFLLQTQQWLNTH